MGGGGDHYIFPVNILLYNSKIMAPEQHMVCIFSRKIMWLEIAGISNTVKICNLTMTDISN